MDNSARRALENAILMTPGSIARIVNAPRHKLTSEEFDRVDAAIKALRREGERVILGADVSNLIGTSLVKQEVLPIFEPEKVSFGFDPSAPFPMGSGYNPVARKHIIHMFCDDAIVAFFFHDPTGYIAYGYRVAGDLMAFGSEAFHPLDQPMWGRIYW